MKTIKDVFVDYQQGLNKLYHANELEAVILLTVSEICNLSKAKIKAFSEAGLTQQQDDKLSEILVQLKTGKPIQYILDKTEFYGLTFNVNPSVLIPRPETEELVEWVLSSVGSGQRAVGNLQSAVGSSQFAVSSGQLAIGNILDVGTGSGCIAISLKKNLQDFSVSAIDISSEALKTAKGNAELNDVNVEFIEADILSPDSPLTTRYSLIVSNPPYVTLHDKTQMHANVTDFEPHNALFVPEEDPLVFYKAIANFAAGHLVPNGLLFFEINESYGDEIVDVLEHKLFKNIELRKDLSGRDRMVKASF